MKIQLLKELDYTVINFKSLIINKICTFSFFSFFLERRVAFKLKRKINKKAFKNINSFYIRKIRNNNSIFYKPL
jgi:hypothetical protein